MIISDCWVGRVEFVGKEAWTGSKGHLKRPWETLLSTSEIHTSQRPSTPAE
jgi:hypothetical protein